MLIKISEIVANNTALCVVFVLLLVLIALAVGYVIGNHLLNKKLDDDIHDVIEQLRYDGAVRTSVIDNVNLGVIAYNKTGLIYSNSTINELEDFLGENKKIPESIDSFLDTYDKKNHLKSSYLLNYENNDSTVRANYVNGKHIYEIKVIQHISDSGKLDIVIVDDITQIKDDERRQRDLAANVSHELKTPLTVIRASEFFVNQITPDTMPSYEEIKKWGNRIVTNAVRMQDIVQDFLILSMCSQSVQMTIIDIGEAINKAVSNLSDYPGRDAVEIVVPQNMYYPLVYGNSNLIMRVIINLLTNAVKYINYEGKSDKNIITIKVVEIGDRIGIQVNDNGRGIPKSDIEHLFERFYRVDNSGSRDVGGTGIGLSIAKDVAGMHDGTINVTSELGSGSSFTLVIPQASGVFKSIYDDAVTGIVSEDPYYRNAADFMAVQTVEAVRSMGYDDALEEAEKYEKTPPEERSSHDKSLAALLLKVGQERYLELVDELTYIEPDDMDDFEEEFDDAGIEDDDEFEVYATNSTDKTEQVEEIPEQKSSIEDEELKKQQKAEARAILTQSILPRANAASKDISKENSNKNEKVTIHPKSSNKMYNSNDMKDNEGAVASTGEQEHQSAVRQVLETSVPLPSVNNDTKGN
ncbi:MAG: ATP-binding protein [Saccharofermentans sp.]|nr:ATP-binding protein [Saccharofermentans sp.]